MELSDKLAMFRNRLTKVYKHLAKQAARQNINCWRVYDHDLPEFPFCIEFYGPRIHVHEYRRHHGLDEEAHLAWLEASQAVICDVLNVAPENVFFKERKRKTDRQDQYEKTDSRAEFFEVMEGGHRFWVNLTDYLDTGLFLDHRITRRKVEQMAAGKRMLNLFCYTGSFSVYAAAGGASYVESVDMSNTYIAWAQRNMELNDLFSKEKTAFIAADVLQYLGEVPSGSFDLIVLDPPTFSNSKRMKELFEVQKDHVWLINECLRCLSPGGQLIFSTNYTRFSLEEEALKTTVVKDITKATTPFDFEGKLKRPCFLCTR